MRQIVRYIAAIIIILFMAETSPAQIIVKVKPARPKIVIAKPAKTKKGHVWIAGHWTVKNKKYIWAKGHWRKVKRNHSWIAGHWKKVRGGWVWMPGHWKKIRINRR